VQIAKLFLYADDTNILVVDKDIKVFELKTALVMKQLLDTELVVNAAKTWLCYFIPLSRNMLINQILCTIQLQHIAQI